MSPKLDFSLRLLLQAINRLMLLISVFLVDEAVERWVCRTRDWIAWLSCFRLSERLATQASLTESESEDAVP